MFGRSSGRHRRPSTAEVFRRIHERFLSRALRSGAAYPRIPVRRVDRGGFGSLLCRPGGRAACERWWTAVFDRFDSAT